MTEKGPLSEVTAALVAVSAAVATRDEAAIRAALEDARGVAPGVQVEEVLLQSYLFLGFPAALEGLALWRDVDGPAEPERASPGPEESGDGRRNRWLARGKELCRMVYGDRYDELRANIRALHPDMERWMLEEGYGKVLGRKALGPGERELCVVSLLAVLDAPVQLHSHLRGALRMGAEPEQVEAALALARPYADETADEHARETWKRVRSGGGGG